MAGAAYPLSAMCSDKQPVGAPARRRLVALIGAMLLVACGSATPGPVGAPLNVYELKFRVMDAVGTPVYCDPDFYPVARDGSEQTNAIAAYTAIRAQTDLYAAIVAYEHLPT